LSTSAHASNPDLNGRPPHLGKLYIKSDDINLLNVGKIPFRAG
jgi:hypothetical protein